MSLVLASGSERRLALLRRGGLDPVVRRSEVDETPRATESPAALVRRLAHAKATAVAGDVVLGADTEVALDGRVLGKPRDLADARTMLHDLSGRVLAVWSGVAVATARGAATAVVGSLLQFATLTDAVVEDYLATGEPLGVAGAFRIQGQGAALVADRHGCWTNVVGLPTCEAARLLRPHGIALRPDGCRPTGPGEAHTPTAS